MINIIEQAEQLCNKKTPFIIASIIFKHGSAPREVGATMIVTQDKKVYGTIGGGQQEYEVINKCYDLIREKKSENKYYEVSKDIAAQNGLVCGGKNIVHFQYIDVEDESNLNYFKSLLNAKDSEETYLVLDVEDKNIDSGISIEIGNKKYSFLGNEKKERKIFKIKIKKPMKVYIFGGGHLSKETTRVLSYLNLDIVVIDDREEFLESFEFKNIKKIVMPFENTHRLDIKNSDYVLIMTRGHKYDVKVLEKILPKNPYYIGVVGNKIKAKTYKDRFKNTEVEHIYEEKIHLPVGIKISALTPEEIAISIAGEIIKSYRQNRWNEEL